MKKCIQCGGRELTHAFELVPYSGVAVVEADIFTCRSCNERYEGFKAIEELSKQIAMAIARGPERLLPLEIRFLRTYLGYASKDLAKFLDVAPETMSRWESRTSPMEMSLSTEKLLRFMALTERPITDYGMDTAGTQAARADKKRLFRQRDGAWELQP